MKKTIVIVLMSLSTTFFSYGYAADNHGHSNHGSEVSIHELSLNNAERWNMDEHTRIMSQKMKKTFFNADHSTQAGLNAAGVELQTQVEILIAGCTMQGKAHDQLHIFLSNHIPTINALSEADDYTSARASAIQLKGQFEVYQKHFK